MKWSIGLAILLLSTEAWASSSFTPCSSTASIRTKGITALHRIPILCLQGGSTPDTPSNDDFSQNETKSLAPTDPEQPPITPPASLPVDTAPPPPVEPAAMVPATVVPATVAPPEPPRKPVASVAVTPSQWMGPNATPPGFLRRQLPYFPWHRLPNFLTYARCLAIPAMMVLFYQPDRHVATSVLFAGASLTDWFDGFLARRWDIASPFGAFLDPVADKLMVSTSLILLAGRYGAPVAIPATIILAREIAVSALREWMGQRGLRDSVKVGYQGKVKTALTMMSLTLLLLVPEPRVGVLGKLYEPCMGLLALSALITVTSGSVYFRAAAPVLLSRDQSSRS